MNEIIYSYEPLWGSWHIKQLIGEGSSGKVYKISKTVFEKEYVAAVKVISIPKNSDLSVASVDTEEGLKKYNKSVVSGIIKEIDMLYLLKGHGNIIIYEDHMIEETEDAYHIFIRMEYADSLKNFIAKKKNFNLKEIAKLGIDICNALMFCHSKGIMHRDIKEANVFISTENNWYKLGDFGVSKEISDFSYAQTRVGTINYMPPEVFKGNQYTKNADIYSLGIMLYKLLNNNRMPFMPKFPLDFTAQDVEKAHLKRMSGNNLEFPSNGNSEINKIVLKACSYNQSERYQTSMELKEDLLRFYNTCSDESGTVTPGISSDNSLNETVFLNESLNYPSTRSTSTSSNLEDATVGIFDSPKKIRVDKKKLFITLGSLALISSICILFFGGFVKTNKFYNAFNSKSSKSPKVASIATNTTTVTTSTPVSPTLTATDLKTLLTPTLKVSPTPSSSSSNSSSLPVTVIKEVAPVAPVQTKTSGINIIKNGSCENKDKDWQISSSYGSTASTSFSDESKKSGIYSLKITKTNTSGGHSFFQWLDISKGKKYLYSGYYKINNIANSRGGSGGISFKASYRKNTNDGINEISTKKVTGTKDWTKFSMVIEIPADLSYEILTVYLSNWGETGTAYFDDISLEEIIS